MGGRLSSSLKIGIFGGLSVTAIVWFLLIKGLKGSTLMTPEVNEMISQNTWLIIGGSMAVFSVLMTLLSAMKLPVLKFVVLLGTFALAMAFAGNDLVNFVGVPLTGLEAWLDYTANGNGDAQDFMMRSLMESAHTPAPYLIVAGVVMVLALIFSKKGAERSENVGGPLASGRGRRDVWFKWCGTYAGAYIEKHGRQPGEGSAAVCVALDQLAFQRRCGGVEAGSRLR